MDDDNEQMSWLEVCFWVAARFAFIIVLAWAFVALGTSVHDHG